MPDPDLEVGGEGRSSSLLESGGGGSPKFFSALWASVWSKNKGGLGPPGPSPGSATAAVHLTFLLYSFPRVHG